jgi:propionyl-CoA synthetase
MLLEMLDKAIEMSDHKPANRIILQRDACRVTLDHSLGDLDWHEEMQRVRAAGTRVMECVPVESEHPLYILYTSGTTGLPKVMILGACDVTRSNVELESSWLHPSVLGVEMLLP